MTNFTKPQFVVALLPMPRLLLKINGIAVGQAVADSLGNFTFTAPETLTDGAIIWRQRPRLLMGAVAPNLSLLSIPLPINQHLNFRLKVVCPVIRA
ncbi:hypothetical protein [Salmonella enterica]|uniref:hypothetical protein n=1 Tax=Salmonella enterica TaxID=28901 RepID=UPI002452EAB1|nr:hypothetical protein [Salmonella enterica]